MRPHLQGVHRSIVRLRPNCSGLVEPVGSSSAICSFRGAPAPGGFGLLGLRVALSFDLVLGCSRLL